GEAVAVTSLLISRQWKYARPEHRCGQGELAVRHSAGTFGVPWPLAQGIRYAALLSAARSFSSASLERDVFRTRGLYCLISGSTLSSVTLLSSTKSAEDPSGIVAPSFLMKSSGMP